MQASKRGRIVKSPVNPTRGIFSGVQTAKHCSGGNLAPPPGQGYSFFHEINSKLTHEAAHPQYSNSYVTPTPVPLLAPAAPVAVAEPVPAVVSSFSPLAISICTVA